MKVLFKKLFDLDIPNLEKVTLASPFRNVISKSISSKISLISLHFLDVHPLLSQYFPQTTYTCDYIQSIPSTNTTIILPDWTCNDLNYTMFDFSRFTNLAYLEIGSESFKPVKIFRIENMNELSKLIIHNNSFAFDYYEEMLYEALFRIKNCGSLESIEIGSSSFADYSGDFNLLNLPSLQSIKIGSIVSEGYAQSSFDFSSLSIRGKMYCSK